MSEAMFGGNPSDRLDPSFSPEEEHMAHELQPVVVGPPAYTSPDPATQSGRLVPIEEHPFVLSDDYGADALDVPGQDPVVDTDKVESSRTPKVDDAPDDRDDWTKDDWQAQARAYGLATGGTKADLQARVEDHEA